LLRITNCFFFVPLASLIKDVGSFATLGTAFVESGSELIYTLIFSTWAAALCAAVSLPVAWTFVRIRHTRILIFLCIIFLLAIPAPITGIGIIQLFSTSDLWVKEHLGFTIIGRLNDAGAAIVIGYAVRFLPFALLVHIAGIRRIPLEHEDAARIEGATVPERLLHVILPLSLRPFMIGAFIVFILSIGEVATTILTCPPGVTPLSIRFFTLIHSGLRPKTSAICLIILFVVMLPAALLVMLIWRFIQKRLE
jgi:iron(III) transport system permease protein